MGQSKLLIVIPLKTQPHYQKRKEICESTWLKDCPVDYKFFSDAELGLDESDPQIRPKRTIGMVRYVYDRGYAHCFRVDSDAFVWIDRLLASGFEQFDYMGLCNDYPLKQDNRRTAHGGCGFILSRRAMGIVANAQPFLCMDGKYWGDIWVGEVLYKHGIRCHRDTRFYSDKFLWEGKDLSDAISIHPVIEDD